MNLSVTKTTVAEFIQTQKLLSAELEKLAAMTRRYPVVCTFSGYRYVFESRDDITKLIQEINQAIEVYDLEAA